MIHTHQTYDDLWSRKKWNIWLYSFDNEFRLEICFEKNWKFKSFTKNGSKLFYTFYSDNRHTCVVRGHHYYGLVIIMSIFVVDTIMLLWSTKQWSNFTDIGIKRPVFLWRFEKEKKTNHFIHLLIVDDSYPFF